MTEKVFCLLAVLILFFSSAVAQEGDASSLGNPEQRASEGEQTEPLEPWIRGSSKERGKDASGSTEVGGSDPMGVVNPDLEEEKRLFDDLLKSSPDEGQATFADDLLKSRRVVLTKEQRKRLDRIEKKQKAAIAAQSAWVKKINKRKRKGDAEVRVCSLNVNSYGTKDAKKKLLRSTSKGGRAKALVDAIVEAECGVVALQGLLALNPADGQKALEILTKRLERDTPWQWQSFLAIGNNRLAFNAFLVSNDQIMVEGQRSFSDLPLVRYPGFEEKKFACGPFAVSLWIRKRDGEGLKQVVLVTDYWRKGSSLSGSESEGYRMQMAETMRERAQLESFSVMAPKEPVFVFLIERAESNQGAAARILEGTVRLDDFVAEGRCDFLDQEKNEERFANKNKKTVSSGSGRYSCSAAVRNSKLLFPLFADNLMRQSVSSRIVDGKKSYFVAKPTKQQLNERKIIARQKPEIYVLQRDLAMAWVDEYSPLRYGVQSYEVGSGSEDSPLLAVDLNW